VDRITGLKGLKPNDLQASDRQLLSKARAVIAALLSMDTKTERDIMALSPAESDALVLNLIIKLLKHIDPENTAEIDPTKNIGALKFPYIYNLISKHRNTQATN